MLCITALLASVPTPQGPGPSTAPVVINELSYDDASTDQLEFVELFNRTNAAIDISGWRLQGEEGDAAGAANLAFTFPAGTLLSPGQYLVVGNTAVPNVSFTVAANFLENGTAEGLTLRDATNQVVDGVAYGYAAWTAATPAWLEGSLWGRLLLNDGATFLGTRQAWARWQDGYDSNNNSLDFLTMSWTPGASNASGNVLAIPYRNVFDGLPGTNVGADFASSFVAPVVQDPAAVTNATASTLVLPPSPQGGNITVWNDPTGGGNSHTLRVPPGDSFLVECYVYVKGGTAALSATEGECWAVGIGTTDSYGAPVDLPGTYYATTTGCTGAGNREPGATGIAWFAFNTAGNTSLYLADLNDGGPGFTVLAGPIVCTTGVNDGWQRLRLRVSGSAYSATFGGTFACNDGQSFSGTLSQPVTGQPYFQYRECIVTNANMSPLLVDRLEVYGALAQDVSFAGVASPTTVGSPVIGITGGLPIIGNTALQITGSGLVPSGITGIVLGLGNLDPGTPLPGAPVTVQVHVVPVINSNLLFPDGSGNASFALGIPCNNSMVGLPITAQLFDLDLALTAAVPVGCSPGMRVLVGN